MINLIPMSGYVLVELTEEYEGVYTIEKKYDTKTSGLVITVGNNQFSHQEGTKFQGMDTFETKITYSYDYLVGKKIYFEGFKDDSKVPDGDKTYAFIDIKDIRGYKGE